MANPLLPAMFVRFPFAALVMSMREKMVINLVLNARPSTRDIKGAHQFKENKWMMLILTTWQEM
jgi:hypothetical protein